MKASLVPSTQQTLMSSSRKQLEGISIRRYSDADHPHIVDICKNVYGGTDVLPRTIQTELAHNQAATVLVSQSSNNQMVNGVVCAEVRGCSSYLFGLRVAEEARGNGVASSLMAAICHHSSSLAGVQHIQTTTIPANPAAIRIFQALGFSHSRTVDRWPQDHLQHGYEAAIGFVPNTQQPHQPVQHQQDQPHMLDHIPGARELIMAAAADARPSDWVSCSSTQQLGQAVASIRLPQVALHPYAWLDQGGYVPPLDWLPWVFEVQPVNSDWVQQRIAAGEIWLLPAAQPAAHTQQIPAAAQPAAHTQQMSAYSAVVVLSHSALNSRTCAGVLAAYESGVAAAIELVDSKVPHFVAYIDSGSRHSSGAVDSDLQLPAVLDLGRQGLPCDRMYMAYLVYSRDASSTGLPVVDFESHSRL